MSVTVIPDIIPRSLWLAAEAAWPAPDWPYWHRYNGPTANKFGSMDRARIPAACIAALDALALAVIPHIGDSFVDYDLHAAGLHQLPPGGFLARHLDAECHPIRSWRRTHSIVLSVNSEWRDEWGGQLCIEHRRSSEFIRPEQGKVIIFDTPGQWHEVAPVAGDCPAYRKTLALFAWQVDHDRSGRSSANFTSK